MIARKAEIRTRAKERVSSLCTHIQLLPQRQRFIRFPEMGKDEVVKHESECVRVRARARARAHTCVYVLCDHFPSLVTLPLPCCYSGGK